MVLHVYSVIRTVTVIFMSHQKNENPVKKVPKKKHLLVKNRVC